MIYHVSIWKLHILFHSDALIIFTLYFANLHVVGTKVCQFLSVVMFVEVNISRIQGAYKPTNTFPLERF